MVQLNIVRISKIYIPTLSFKGEENAAVEHSKDHRSDDHTGDGNKDGLNSELGAKIPNRGDVNSSTKAGCIGVYMFLYI